MQVRDAVENSEGRGPLNGVSTGALDLTIGDLILLKKLLSAFAACSARAVVAPLETTSHLLLRSRKVLHSSSRIPQIMLSLKAPRIFCSLRSCRRSGGVSQHREVGIRRWQVDPH